VIEILKDKNENEVFFKGTVVRKTYDGGDYKVYALDVDKNIYPEIKFTKYNNAVIAGETYELSIGAEYSIFAVEQETKYGYSYKIINIRGEKPKSSSDMYYFLRGILTLRQAETLYNVYPDIVDRVMSNNLDDIDLNKLNGIKEYTFNIIKNKIVENFCLAELTAEFQGLLSLSMLKKLFNKYTSVQMIKKKFYEDPYKCLCGLAGVGFVTADRILMELDKIPEENFEKEKNTVMNFESDLKTSPQRCLSCMLYFLRKNEEEGHTRMSVNDLRNQCIKLVPACSSHFDDCVRHKSIYYDKELNSVSLKNTYDTEKFIVSKILLGLGNKNNKWNFDCKKYKLINEYELSEEQMSVLDTLCKYNICILNGSAGVGKTSCTQAIINMLKENNKSFSLFAPTGKAAKVLSEYTKENAATIHRGLGYRPPNIWQFNSENKLDCDVLIIDEFSMTDIFLFKKVLEAIDFNRTKLLLIGDNAQIPSVSCGNLLHDFMLSNIIPTVTLTKVFRYGEGGLMKVATDVRLCKRYLSGIKNQLTWFGNNKDYAFVNISDRAIIKNAAALYKKLISQGYNPDDIQVLTSYKKGDCGTLAINNAIQKAINPNYGSENYMKVGNTVYFKGDIVIQNVNNYKAEIFIEDDFILGSEMKKTFIANGETGIVKDVLKNSIIIDFDGTKVRYYASNMENVELGYCITIHKSQGSSIKVVILLTPRAHTYMLNSNLIYVGMTRTKEKCFHLGDVKTVNSAVRKKENFTRNTFIQSMFKDCESKKDDTLKVL